jgi:hypothetical protein
MAGRWTLFVVPGHGWLSALSSCWLSDIDRSGWR